jgi:hypothetical protein
MYSSPNIIRVIKSKMMRVGNVVHMGKMRNAYNSLVRNPEGKKPFTRPRHMNVF